MNDTSVVIVTYNGAPWIESCIHSVISNSKNVHIIVVDNASTDQTTALIKGNFPSVELVILDENVGFGGGNNIGISIALERRAEYIYLLNQDACVIGTAIDEMVEFMGRNREYGIVSPLHYGPDSDHLDRKTMHGYLYPYAPKFLADVVHGDIDPYYDILGINAAAWFCRADVFQRAGGFDPLFFMYGEDDDMITRFAFHGIKFALLPSAKIVHYRETSSTPPRSFTECLSRQVARERSKLLTEIKRPGYSAASMLLILFVNGYVRAFADFLLDRQTIPFLGRILAATRLVFNLSVVRKNRSLTMLHGPHFLNIK